MEVLAAAVGALVGVVGAYVVSRLRRRQRSHDDIRNGIRNYFHETTESGWWLVDVSTRTDLPRGDRVRLQTEASKRAAKLHMSWDIVMPSIIDDDLRGAINELDGVTQRVFQQFATGASPDLEGLRAKRHELRDVARRVLKLRL